jgi:RecB family exonuclease
MPEHHHNLSPSKFPAWAICPAFDSDPAPRGDATEGTAQHAALSALLTGGEPPPLSTDAAESVQWAKDYIHTLSGVDPILSEQRVQFSTPDAFAPGGESVLYFGTADGIIIRPPGNMADLIDYKSGADDHDHRAQLAGYALALFSMRKRLKVIRCHVLYARVRRVDSWSLTQAEAAGIVLPILASRQKDERNPTASHHCGFCVHRATCPALTAQVGTVAKAHDWESILPALRDPGALSDPSILSKALTLARLVGTWADAVRKTATDRAKAGDTIPGYRLQERKASPELSDPAAAMQRTGLDLPEFMQAVKVSIPKLADLYAAAQGMPKTRARSQVEEILADLLQVGPPSYSLVSAKGGE